MGYTQIMLPSKTNVLQEAMATPLSGGDLSRLIPNAPIHPYNELENVRRLDDLFGPDNSCFVLYLIQSSTSGHWVCLQDLGNKVEFFDSYGGNGRPDSQLRWVPKDKREDWGEDSPLLMRLIRESGKELVYNKARLQKECDNVTTCGRHCAVRLMHSAHALPDYINWLERKPNSPDEIVTEITYRLLGH